MPNYMDPRSAQGLFTIYKASILVKAGETINPDPLKWETHMKKQALGGARERVTLLS